MEKVHRGNWALVGDLTVSVGWIFHQVLVKTLKEVQKGFSFNVLFDNFYGDYQYPSLFHVPQSKMDIFGSFLNFWDGEFVLKSYLYVPC